MAGKKDPLFDPLSGKQQLLNQSHELFCVLYTSNSTPRFFGHGQNCYAMAYGRQEDLDDIAFQLELPANRRTRKDKKSRKVMTEGELRADRKKIENVCRVEASKLLKHPYVIARCRHLFNSFLKNECVDQELAFTIMQRHDLPSKIAGIREYNQMRKRIGKDAPPPDGAPQKVKVEFSWEDPEPRPGAKSIVKVKTKTK
jgi:hypothetical protein